MKTYDLGKGSGASLLVLLGLACAPALGPNRLGMDRQLIVEAEIEGLNAANALEIVQKIRPNFLSYRGETSLNRSQSSPYPTIYIDGIAFGPIETLRTISAVQVGSIRLYRSWEATTRFGLGNMGGVIDVTTKR